MALPEGARCLAVLDVILQAFLVFVLFDGFSSYCLMAPSQRIEVADQFEQLLYGASIVCTPGVGFGPSGEGYVRLTAFGNREDCEEAMRRMAEWMAK